MNKRFWLQGTRFVILGGILFGLQLRLWQAGGLLNTYRLHKKVAVQTAVLSQHEARNRQLSAQLDWLRHAPEAVEHYARQSLGMIKQGETFYVWADRE